MALTEAERRELEALELELALSQAEGNLTPEEQAELNELNGLAADQTPKSSIDLSAPINAFIGELQQGPGLRPNPTPPIQTAGTQMEQQNPIMASLFGGPTPGAFMAKEFVTDPAAMATAASVAVPPAGLPAQLLSRSPILKDIFANMATKIPAAAGGGAIAGGTDAAIEGGDIPGQALESGLDMAGAEALGIGVLGGARKLFNPFAGRMTEESSDLMTAAREEGIPLMPSSINPSIPAKIIEGGSDTFIASKLTNDLYRKKTITQLNRMMAEIPQEIGPVPGREVAAQVTEDAFKNVLDLKMSTAKRLSTEFLEDLGRDKAVKIANTKKVLDDILVRSKNKDLRGFAELELNRIAGSKTLKAEELEETLRQIGQATKKVRGRDSAIISELRDAIKNDFKAAGADMGKLTKANQFFASNAALMKEGGQIASMLKAGRLPPAALTVRIFRSGNEDFIRSLKNELPEEAWDTLRAQNIANLLENASKESDRLPGFRILTNTNKLEKALSDNRQAFEAAYDADTMKAIDRFVMLAKAGSKDVGKFERGLDALNLGSAGAFVPSLAKGAADPSVIVGTASSMAVGMSLIKPDGVLKRWLTTGFKSRPTLSEVMKVGIRNQSDGE